MKTLMNLILGLLIGAAPGLAGPTTWKVDKSHSQVRFTVTHLVISEVEGRFKDFDATLTNSKDDFSDATLTATIQMASIDTDIEKRDAHLKSDDFFNVEKYPEMTFSSTSFKKSGKGFKITGDLTIRDITRKVVLDTDFKGTTQDAWGNTRAVFKATTAINRFEFGTKWNAALETGSLIVGDEVQVTLTMQLIKQR